MAELQHTSCQMVKLSVIRKCLFSLTVAALHLPVMPWLELLRVGGIQWHIWQEATHR